ncbi:MAG: hypothetical protein MJ137_07430 [Clostridia bacterium]|nr:hypothetical protein [Clostridia bacterium]
MTAGYRIVGGESGWHYELVGLPDKLLLTGNTYAGRQHCLESLGTLRLICDAPLDTGCGLRYPKYTVEHTGMGFFVLTLRGKNGRTVARGPECRSAASASAALPEILRTARTAPVLDA